MTTEELIQKIDALGLHMSVERTPVVATKEGQIMSKQRKKHRNLAVEQRFWRYFFRAMDRDTRLARRTWKTGLAVNRKRWK